MNPKTPRLLLESHADAHLAVLATPGTEEYRVGGFYFHSPKARGEYREHVRTELRGSFEDPCAFTGLLAEPGTALFRFDASALAEGGSAVGAKVEMALGLGPRDLAAHALDADTGMPHKAGAPLLLATAPFREIDRLREFGKGLHCEEIALRSAALAQIGAVAMAQGSGGLAETVALVAPSPNETRIMLVGGGRVLSLRSVPVGLDGVFASIQAQLSLKFVGSAAKLFYDGVYDFSEVAETVTTDWVAAVRRALDGDPAPSRIFAGHLPPTAVWLGETLAKGLGIPLVEKEYFPAMKAAEEASVIVDHTTFASFTHLIAHSGGTAFAAADWLAAPPLGEVLAKLPLASSPKATAPTAPAPTMPASGAPTTKRAPASGSTQQKERPATAKVAPPAKPMSAPAAAAIATPPQATAPAAAKDPAPVATDGEGKKPPFALLGGIAALLAIGVVLFFLFGRDPSEVTPIALAAPPPPPVPVKEVAPVEEPLPEPEVVEEAPPPPPSMGRLSLTGEPGAARVHLDERFLGETPLDELEISPGTYTLRIEADHYLPFEKVIEIEPGELLAIETPPLTRLSGGLVLLTEPAGAQVFDASGRRLGRSPLELEDLLPGPHKLRIELDDYEPLETTADVVHGEIVRINALRLSRLTGSLSVQTTPPGIGFRVEDAAGKVHHEGTTPDDLEAIPTGPYRVIFARDEWPNFTRPARIQARESTTVAMDYPEGRLVLHSDPSGAEVWHGEKALGRTPLELDGLRPGRLSLEVRLDGHLPESVTAAIEPNAETREEITLVNLSRIFRPDEVDDLPTAREQTRPESNMVLIREENVMARFVVNREGMPEAIQIHSSTNSRLNPLVLETIASWRFEPARIRGEPVRMSIGVPFVFQPSRRAGDE